MGYRPSRPPHPSSPTSGTPPPQRPALDAGTLRCRSCSAHPERVSIRRAAPRDAAFPEGSPTATRHRGRRRGRASRAGHGSLRVLVGMPTDPAGRLLFAILLLCSAVGVLGGLAGLRGNGRTLREAGRALAVRHARPSVVASRAPRTQRHDRLPPGWCDLDATRCAHGSSYRAAAVGLSCRDRRRPPSARDRGPWCPGRCCRRPGGARSGGGSRWRSPGPPPHR